MSAEWAPGVGDDDRQWFMPYVPDRERAVRIWREAAERLLGDQR